MWLEMYGRQSFLQELSVGLISEPDVAKARLYKNLLEQEDQIKAWS